MRFEVSAKVVAAALGLAAFAVAVLAGLHAGNPSRSVLVNALVALIVGQVVGFVVGVVGERVVREQAAAAAAVPTRGPDPEVVSPGGGAAR